MRRMRGVGAVVVGIAAAVVLSGCGSSGGDEAKPAPSASKGAVDPKPSEPEPSVEYPATPEGDVDRLADEKGWVVDDLYPSASDFVADICESLPVSAVDGASRPQWLAESGNMDGDGKAVLQAGIPKLCPKWTSVLKQAVSGKYDRWFGDGTYVVSSKPAAADENEETIPPGTYRARGSMKDCYWERTAKSGDIIDNRLATSAQEIRVTIRASDGQFTSERCAVWKPVK
ncbi:hypothetical protein [Streptomyces sp. NPDC046631]|uniref:hypothetical protein n=1 Tax=unclassified Streptomyces TaxID=2593676 RepID=UPI0033E7FB14